MNGDEHDVSLAASRLIRQFRRSGRILRDLKASYEVQRDAEKAREAELRAAALALLQSSARHKITTLEGEIAITSSVKTIPNPVALRAWVEANKPELLVTEVKVPSLNDLAAHGAWLDGRFMIDGEIVPGLEQIETPAARLTVSKAAPPEVEDDE